MYMHTHTHSFRRWHAGILGNWRVTSPFPVECAPLLECVLLGILGNWLVASPFPMELNVQAKTLKSQCPSVVFPLQSPFFILLYKVHLR